MSAKVHPVIDIPSSDDEEIEPVTIMVGRGRKEKMEKIDTKDTTAKKETIPVQLPLSSDQPHLSSSVKCSLWYETYKRCVILSGIILLIAIIALIVYLKGSNTTADTSSTNPCEGYKADDFASSVSLACFRYMWANAGCKSAVPDNYAGWYLRSPDGGKTVLCIPPKTGALCGAGSYGAILNSIWRCSE